MNANPESSVSPQSRSTAAGSQSGLIDFLKLSAAQLIILHHLAFYGPMADHAQILAPQLIDWLAEYGRIAVQVFLVIGGFLAAKSLSSQASSGVFDPLRTILRRYIKLVPPFMVATLLGVGASAWARLWMTHDSISAPAEFLQLISHAFLLHGILGFESISAGAWYVAIDFQLYACLTLMLWLSARVGMGQPLPWLMPVLVVASVAASLLYFNRDSVWDVWAPYFFGSYGLGVLAWWASDPSRRPAVSALLLTAMLLLTLAALAIDFRVRIAVALIVACSLVLMRGIRPPYPARIASLISRLGQASYSIFLIHFPVSLIVNAAFTRFLPAQPLVQATGMLLAWAACIAAGMGFHRWVELPLNRLFSRSSLGAGFVPSRGSNKQASV